MINTTTITSVPHLENFDCSLGGSVGSLARGGDSLKEWFCI
jgi:hypothetical protein